MIRVAGLAAAAVAATTLSACESTQDRAAKVQAQGTRALANRHGLKISRTNRAVKVLGKTILHDANGTAAVVELVNRGPKPQAQVPVAIELGDAAGKKLFANDAPGLEPALVSVALLPRNKPTIWVHNQVIATQAPRRLRVRVGTAPHEAIPAKPPHITLSGVHLDHDSSGAYATGTVTNRSKVLQKRLTIFCAATKGGQIVAAGRAVVEKLAPAPTPKPIHFTVYFIGNPAGGTLEFSVPPVKLR